MFDYSKIRGKIRELYGTQGAFAAKLGITECAVSEKLNGRTPWKQTEIQKAAKLLNLSVSDFFREHEEGGAKSG